MFVWTPIKLVRDHLGRLGLKNPEVKLEAIPTIDRGRLLRDKLAEECHEYQEDRTPRELVDIVEACFALADHEHGLNAQDLLNLAVAKREQKGGFRDCVGLYVKVTVDKEN